MLRALLKIFKYAGLTSAPHCCRRSAIPVRASRGTGWWRIAAPALHEVAGRTGERDRATSGNAAGAGGGRARAARRLAGSERCGKRQQAGVAAGGNDDGSRGGPRSGGNRYWTDFRGPLRDGHYRERPIFTEWPASGLKPVWKQPVGAGYASFVVAHGRAFTIEQRGAQEVVAAYDVATGRELWTNAWTAAFREMMGGDGPRATPTWADGRVYALGAQGELRCMDDATGRTVWRINILEDTGAKNLPWGMAASPLVVDNTVVGTAGRIEQAVDRGV